MPKWTSIQTLRPPRGKPVELDPWEEDYGQNLGASVAISPHGEFIASYVMLDGATRFWRIAGDGNYRLIPMRVPKLDMVAHWSGREEGEFLGVGTRDRMLYRLDLDGQVKERLPIAERSENRIIRFRVSPNGHYALMGSAFWDVRLYDLHEMVCTWSGEESGQPIAISNRMLVTVSRRVKVGDGPVKDWKWAADPDEDPKAVVTTVGYDLCLRRIPTGEIVRRISVSRESQWDWMCFFQDENLLVYVVPIEDADNRCCFYRWHIDDDRMESLDVEELWCAVPFNSHAVIGGAMSGQLLWIDLDNQIVEPIDTGMEIKDNILSVAASQNGRIVFCSRDGVMAVGRID